MSRRRPKQSLKEGVSKTIMSGMGMIACAVAYLVPLVLIVVTLVKVNGIAKNQERTLPRS